MIIPVKYGETHIGDKSEDAVFMIKDEQQRAKAFPLCSTAELI